jgi:hypothetical protein
VQVLIVVLNKVQAIKESEEDDIDKNYLVRKKCSEGGDRSFKPHRLMLIKILAMTTLNNLHHEILEG